MAITDNVLEFVTAAVAIINADTELRTLFGRNDGLIVPWDTLEDNTVLPVICYAMVTHVPLWRGVERLEIQFTAFAASMGVANKAMYRLPRILNNVAFAARGVQACRDPESPALRRWPGVDAQLGDTASARADSSLMFLITG